MDSSVLQSVEYLHSMSCRRLLPLYVVYSTRCPCEFHMYPLALMMPGLWCFGLLCLGSMFLVLRWGVLLPVCRSLDLLVWLVMFVDRGPLVA